MDMCGVGAFLLCGFACSVFLSLVCTSFGGLCGHVFVCGWGRAGFDCSNCCGFCLEGCCCLCVDVVCFRLWGDDSVFCESMVVCFGEVECTCLFCGLLGEDCGILVGCLCLLLFEI